MFFVKVWSYESPFMGSMPFGLRKDIGSNSGVDIACVMMVVVVVVVVIITIIPVCYCYEL